MRFMLLTSLTFFVTAVSVVRSRSKILVVSGSGFWMGGEAQMFFPMFDGIYQWDEEEAYYLRTIVGDATDSLFQSPPTYLYPVSGARWVIGRKSGGKLVADLRSQGNGEGVPLQGWEKVFDTSFEGAVEGSIPEMGVWVSTVPDTVSKRDLLEEDMIREEGIICEGVWGERVFISRLHDPRHCDAKAHCKRGLDEKNCSSIVSPSIEFPIYTTLVVLSLGFILFVAQKAFTRKTGSSDFSPDKRASTRTDLEVAVDTILENFSQNHNPEDSLYDVVHSSAGGLKMLLGSSFTFLQCPTLRHHFALWVLQQEERLHCSDNGIYRKAPSLCRQWHRCLRSKAGSNKGTEALFDSLQPPGIVKKLKFRAAKCVDKLLQPPEPDAKTPWIKLKFIFILGVFPLLKVSLYTLDYVKDACLFIFLYQRIQFSSSALIQGLIYFHGFSVLAAGALMGIIIQRSKVVVNLASVESLCLRYFLRAILLACTPLIPALLVFRMVTLTIKKKQLEVGWRKEAQKISLSQAWHMYDTIDEEKEGLMKLYSEMKIVEASLEATPQLSLLLVFTLASWILPNYSRLGLLEEDTAYVWTFVILSLLQTIVTIVVAVLDNINIHKGNQLNLKCKIVLGLSVLLLILARLLLIVGIIFAGLPQFDSSNQNLSREALSARQTALLLALPLFLHWIALTFLFARLNLVSFWNLGHRDRLLHLLANTWFLMPVRRVGQKDQVDKSQEIFWLFVFANANLILTATAAVTQMEDRCSRLISFYLPYPCLDKSEQPLPFYQDIRYRTEFLLVVCFPAVIFHILAGALLILYYKTCHPWRELGWEREAHCFGKLGKIGSQLTVETPYWSRDVSYKQMDIQEEDCKEHNNPKENIAQSKTKDPDVQDHIVQAQHVQDHIVQAKHVQEHNVQRCSKNVRCVQEHGSRPQDIQHYGTQVVWKRDKDGGERGNVLFNGDRDIDPFRQSTRLVDAENILFNKEDEMSRL